jgi:aquaporin Z
VVGLAIGLTLVMIHLAGITVSGSSVNSARSLGPALFAGLQALSQVWLYFVAPCLGAALVFKAGATRQTAMSGSTTSAGHLGFSCPSAR